MLLKKLNKFTGIPIDPLNIINEYMGEEYAYVDNIKINIKNTTCSCYMFKYQKKLCVHLRTYFNC
jgi:hypothetical protein